MRASTESERLLQVIKSNKYDAENMQGTRWDKYRIDDYSQIKSLLCSDDYFLGVREDYVNIYYKGMSMAKIETYYNRACKYSISYYYVM